MKTYQLPILFILFAFITTGCMTISTNGDYTLEDGRTLHGDFIMTSGDATIEEGSRVTGNVIMTSGTLNVYGQVDGDIRYTSAKSINLGSDSIVGGDITGTSGDVVRAEGSIVEGEIYKNQGITLGIGFFAKVFGILCGIPLFLIVSTTYWVSRRWTKGSHSKPQPAKPNIDDPTARLKQLRQMLDEGLISETDFESKKAGVLADL